MFPNKDTKVYLTDNLRFFIKDEIFKSHLTHQELSIKMKNTRSSNWISKIVSGGIQKTDYNILILMFCAIHNCDNETANRILREKMNENNNDKVQSDIDSDIDIEFLKTKFLEKELNEKLEEICEILKTYPKKLNLEQAVASITRMHNNLKYDTDFILSILEMPFDTIPKESQKSIFKQILKCMLDNLPE